MNPNKIWFPLIVAGLCFSPTVARAAFDIIIDDADAELQVWSGGILQTATGDNSYGGSYQTISGWGAYDGVGQSPNLASARVVYKLPNGVDFPAGENLYNIYAWSPESNWDQWHIVNVAADGLDGAGMSPHISWGGQFGTNQQWLGFDPNEAPDPILGGRWVKLGPGPQTDNSADGGSAVYINPAVAEPFLYVKYQGYYNGTIAFDAIRIVQIPEPSSMALATMGFGLLSLAARRRRRQQGIQSR